jgi:hypothetical protein
MMRYSLLWLQEVILAAFVLDGLGMAQRPGDGTEAPVEFGTAAADALREGVITGELAQIGERGFRQQLLMQVEIIQVATVRHNGSFVGAHWPPVMG